jgi:hypothetical protein
MGKYADGFRALPVNGGTSYTPHLETIDLEPTILNPQPRILHQETPN